MKFDGLVFEIGIMLGAGLLVGACGMYGIFQGIEWLGKMSAKAGKAIVKKIKKEA